MQHINKSFSTRAIQNLLLTFDGVKCEKEILDKPRKVTDYHYCQSIPRVRKNPHIAGLSKRLIETLGYDEQEIISDPNSALYFSGSKPIPGSTAMCHNYCGFQFGVWAGQLGDGRAHTIGHVIENSDVFELQLKGSGINAFSRHADGNSVVSSAVREFLASELMHGLGVPTTRALSLVISEDEVIRDPMYNGIIKKENAAIVIRVAPSFLRFGSFQVTNSNGNMHSSNHIKNRQILSSLADYLLVNVHKQIDSEEGDPYEELFVTIIKKSAELAAHWQSIGFVHGVLNTDNMSMVGVTIDYGPFGFIDYFSKDFVSNATDEYERYSYRRQPDIVKWNLMRLAEAFDILVPEKILKKHIDELFDRTFKNLYNTKMANKLGLEANPETLGLIEELLEIMHECGSNFTNTFRKLSEEVSIEQKIEAILKESLPSEYYKRSIRIVANNNITEEVIESICKEDQGFNRSFLSEQSKRRKILKNLMEFSCEDRTEHERSLWLAWLQKYESLNPNRNKQQENTIKYVLLNEVAKNITEELITLTPESQRDLMSKVLDVFANPYLFNEWFEEKYWKKRPVPVRLTCSS